MTMIYVGHLDRKAMIYACDSSCSSASVLLVYVYEVHCALLSSEADTTEI